VADVNGAAGKIVTRTPTVATEKGGEAYNSKNKYERRNKGIFGGGAPKKKGREIQNQERRKRGLGVGHSTSS